MLLVLITGLSGSGKSIALNALEDASFYCVDNLPAPLLIDLIKHLHLEGHEQVAVAIDMRTGHSIASLPPSLRTLESDGVCLRLLFLEARRDVIIQRYSETRRRHPLSQGKITLEEAIDNEREELDVLRGLGHRVDTSDLRPHALRSLVQAFVLTKGNGITLLFESFGFKYGLPLDADMVFDVRCLPNPFYEPQLRHLTGCDDPVCEFLSKQPDVIRMFEDIQRFVSTWLPAFVRDHRSYLTVAIGCTGGQHRSVWFVEQLARAFESQARVLVRHRALSS